jgi:hypothetical protein
MAVRVKHLALPVSIIAGVGAALITSAVAQSGGERSAQATGSDTLVTFSTFLTGQDELRVLPNPPSAAGKVDAFGEAFVTIDKSNNEICVNFTDTNLGPYNLFHIHAGNDTTRSGPVVVDFEPGAGRVNPFHTCVTDTDAVAIANNPSGFYLNAHTTTFLAGAISGQLGNATTTDGIKETNLLAAPVRAYDTRFNNGTKFAPNTTRTIDLSTFGVPAGARAAIVTVTVTRADAAGFLTVYSNAVTPAPNTSNVNFGAAVDAANNITVAVDSTGKIKITSGATGNEDVIVDVVGYVS